tara:strand:- start:298 stop:510 length:213 start_codon:yes stop_codon:yes gene_type:complete
MLLYYFLIGLGFTFIVEVTTKHYAEEMKIIKGDEDVFESFSMTERIVMITIWPLGILMVIKTLIEKDDEV